MPGLMIGRDQVAAVPGIQTASAGVTLPFGMDRGRCCWRSNVFAPEDAAMDTLMSIIHPIAPSYFETLGTPMMQGREFTQNDDDPASAKIILNATAARRLFPNGDAVGKRVAFSRYEGTVVGVVGDLKHWTLTYDGDTDIYVPYSAFGDEFDRLQIVVKAGAQMGDLGQILRRLVWEIDPELPVIEVATMTTRIARSITEPRFYTLLLITFATIAIVLAAGGIYGTMLYSVSQRNHEFGIRIALGASSTNLLRTVVRNGLTLTITGIALGLVGAVAFSRLLESFVFGITTTDPATFAAVSALLTVVALSACLVPALRAARTDPMETLRGE